MPIGPDLAAHGWSRDFAFGMARECARLRSHVEHPTYDATWGEPRFGSLDARGRVTLAQARRPPSRVTSCGVASVGFNESSWESVRIKVVVCRSLIDHAVSDGWR